MRRKAMVKGFLYCRPRGDGQSCVQVESTWGHWKDEIDKVERSGGRMQRDDDGALGVYDSAGKRIFEVYDRDRNDR